MLPLSFGAICVPIFASLKVLLASCAARVLVTLAHTGPATLYTVLLTISVFLIRFV